MKKSEKMEWLLWILLEDKESGETAGEEKIHLRQKKIETRIHEKEEDSFTIEYPSLTSDSIHLFKSSWHVNLSPQKLGKTHTPSPI